MRIAQVMAGAPAGGAELFFERMSMALHDAGDPVMPVIRQDTARAGRLRAAGLAPVELRFGGPMDIVTGRRLRAALAGFRPDVVVAWMNRAARFTSRGDYVLAGRMGGYYDLGYYRQCDHLIGNTRALVNWMVAQGWPARRAHYLPNFVPDFGGEAAIDRASLGVPQGVPLVLGLGRLHAHKGFDVLIRSVARLPGAHVLIAGEGPERHALEDCARREGVSDRVHLPGWQVDVGALLAACDVFVSSSRTEPLGNMVLEAWSARRPLVAASADGPRELITNGEGMLVNIDDADALANGIQSVLDDPARMASMVAAGRARFDAEFAQAPVVAQWREKLAELAAV